MEKPFSKESVQIVSINNERDLKFIKSDGDAFYKFPVNRRGYPKQGCSYMAFYLTDKTCFKGDRKGIVYYAKIKKYDSMKRENIHKLLAKQNHRNKELYYKIELKELKRLIHNIKNKSSRRVAYCYTSLDKLRKTKDVSNLTLNKREKNTIFGVKR